MIQKGLWFIIFIKKYICIYKQSIYPGGRRGRDRVVVGFTTTYAISADHHWCCEFESGRVVQHYVIKYVSDLRQVGDFLRVPRFPSYKTDRHDITNLLLKVALNPTK
jgi:hypothetical protein